MWIMATLLLVCLPSIAAADPDAQTTFWHRLDRAVLSANQDVAREQPRQDTARDETLREIARIQSAGMILQGFALRGGLVPMVPPLQNQLSVVSPYPWMLPRVHLNCTTQTFDLLSTTACY